MPYPFLGPFTQTYTQYLDDTGQVLVAEPGRSYDMRPVDGADGLTVPPGDGQWGEQELSAKIAKTKAAPAAKGE